MKKRVLVIDDDADTRCLLAEILCDYPVEVFEAATDDEGYQRFLEVGPDLIFLDVLLPRHGGLGLLRKIRGVRGGKDVPVFVMSAVYRSADIRTEAIEQLGARDFLKKPFQIDLLHAKLAALLAERKTEEAEPVTPFNPTEILSRGNLSNLDFPILLKDLAFHKTTGRLNLRQGNAKKIIFFKEGEITFALSNQIRDTLGRHLLSRQLIGEDDYAAGLEAMQRDGKKMGEFLIQRGALEAQAVYDAVRANVLDKVLDLFTWRGGDFLLGPYGDPPAPLPGQPFEVSRVLWEGVQNRFPYERISASLAPHVDLALMPRRDIFDLAGDVPLEKGDLQFLRLLSRLKGQGLGRVLSEVRSEGELRFLYFLILMGYLALTQDGSGTSLGRDLDLADMERIRRARRRLDSLQSRNYFQILEVPIDASDERVRQAYLSKAKEVHPDMLGSHDPAELARIHSEVFHLVQSAYEALKTEARRNDYLRFIQQGLSEEVTDGTRILEAESQYLEGKAHLKRQAWDAAAAAFRKAVDLNPDEGEYLLSLGIARMRQAGPGADGTLDEAKELFRKAAALLPRSPEPSYRLGKIAALRGESDEAAAHFQDAVARSPNHLDSLRELRLMRHRAEKRGSILNSLLGKKETK